MFQTSDKSPILNICFDDRTKCLVGGTSTGFLIFFQIEDKTTLTPIASLSPEVGTEVPCTSLNILHRGVNLLIAGFASGLIRMATFDGELIAEFYGHSRQINAIACHPS